MGNAAGTVHASIRWPNGLSSVYEKLPIDHRIEIEEGSVDFVATSFATSSRTYSNVAEVKQPEPLPSSIETWLIEPIGAPEFSLPDLAGTIWNLQSLRGGPVLLHFWTAASRGGSDQFRLLDKYQSALAAGGLRILTLNVDDPRDVVALQSFLARAKLSLTTLLATEEVAGVYNVVYRYLFDRRRDLTLPTSFLLNKDGMLVKVYQGTVRPDRVLEDVKSIPETAVERMRKALPLGGTLYHGSFQRNDFTYGVAFFQRGYLQQAEASFKQVIAAKPDDPEAYYNLGTLICVEMISPLLANILNTP